MPTDYSLKSTNQCKKVVFSLIFVSVSKGFLAFVNDQHFSSRRRGGLG